MLKLRLVAAAVCGALFSLPAAAVPVITVTPWLAPNAFGSPSFAGAQTHAVNGMIAGNNGGGVATGSGPQAFTPQTTSVTASEVIVTGFNSWHGVTNPGAAFGAAYAAELGNRMTFALFIDGQGTQFSISQLSFNAVSSDPGNLLGFGFPNGYTYSDGYVGILFGADGKLGGGDDQYVTSGADTQLVDALAGRGSGNSFAAYCPPAPAVCDDAAQAAAIADAAAAFGPGHVSFTGTYTLNSVTGGPLASGSGSFDIVTPANGVPEPTSVGLALLGLGLLAASRGRRPTPDDASTAP